MRIRFEGTAHALGLRRPGLRRRHRREIFSIDQSKHSLFGASKVAGDVMVQEYGRYFGMKTCCLRGGCLTGPNHSGVELHGFLSYLVKCNVEGRLYKVFGYKGKQVRDNIHSLDVARFIHAFCENPRCGEVYNIGGGRRQQRLDPRGLRPRCRASAGKTMNYEYVDQNRAGDHICYISDLAKMRAHYPGWDITKTLDTVFKDRHHRQQERRAEAEHEIAEIHDAVLVLVEHVHVREPRVFLLLRPEIPGDRGLPVRRDRRHVEATAAVIP